jgi:polysaccharide biosynthesis/export protein
MPFSFLRWMVAVTGVLLSACSHTGPFVWADQYTAPDPNAPGYIIATGDLLAVRVWNQEGMSARVRVREDGKISLPFLNDVMAAGYTPNVLSSQLQTRLKDFIANPVVTISLEEPRPFSVPVMGEVVRPGPYVLEQSAGVLHALAAAGGLGEYAHRDRIFVIRQKPAPARIRFTYEALTTAVGKAAAFRLQSGDVVVVE